MNRNKMINVRGAAVLAVLMIHITSVNLMQNGLYSDDFLKLMLNTLSRFAVPTFFISSGYGLCTTYYKYDSIKDFYKSRIKVIPDFIFWSIVFSGLTGNLFSIKGIVKLLIGKSYYHMYFIPALLVCYLIFPLIYKYFNTTKKLITLILLGLVFQSFRYFGVNLFFPELIGFIPYFIIGIMLQKNSILLGKLKKHDLLLLFSGTIVLYTNVIFDYLYTNKDIATVTTSLKPSVVIFALGVVIFMVKRFPNPVKFLSILDVNSMTIYYVHPIFLVLLNKIYDKYHIDSNNLIMIFASLLILLLASLTVSVIISKLKNITKKLKNK